MDSPSISVNVDVPVYGVGYGERSVEVRINSNYSCDMTNAATFVHSILQQSQDSYIKRQHRERSLKRRRTDDDLQRDRRAREDENIDFCLAGVNSRSHFRMKRGDPLSRSLDAFAEQKGKRSEYLRLFYGGQFVPAHISPSDIDLESGESLEVYELIE